MCSYCNMHIIGSFLILFAGLLFSSWAMPYLQDNGYRDILRTKTDADIETLAGETKRKVFTVNYDGSDLDGPFDWASQTYVPAEVVGDNECTIADIIIPGRDSIPCSFLCANFIVAIDDQCNRNVVMYIRLAEMGHDPPQIKDFIKSISVINLDTGNVVGGYTFSIDEQTNVALLKHPNPEPGNFQVHIEFKREISLQFFIKAQVIGHRISPSSEPYTVECKYPDELAETEYLITSFVKQGQTTVKGAVVYAWISKSQDEDASGMERSCLLRLVDDGLEQVNGDLVANDGVYSYILDPRNCWDTPPSNGERMQVMCTMVSSSGTKVTENDFFSKRKLNTSQVPNDSDSGDEKFVTRNTNNTSIKVELNILERDWFTTDFGPPGRITNLRATRVGDEKSGIVELNWTGAGDDPAYGTPASYDVHYSTKRSNLYTKNLKMSSPVTSMMLTAGSLEPFPIGQKMGITVRIPDLEVPGTYHFAVRAVDNHGQKGKASNIVTVNFHDGSPVVRDVSPLHAHGIQTSEDLLIEKLRKRYKDERIVQGYLKKAAKITQMVWEAENSVMEKRLRKWFGDNEKVLANIINTIKTNPKQRNIYKKILL